MSNKFNELADKLGLKFKNFELLKEALTHSSYLNDNPRWSSPHNERLEYLGDAILGLIVSEFLYLKFPDYNEELLTKLEAALVNHQMLSKVGREISLQKYLMLSLGIKKDNERGQEGILADAMEALIGAVYLDLGLTETKRLIKNLVLKHLDEIIAKGLYQNSKSLLQETIQEEKKVTPIYRILEESGPSHRKKFLVGVFLEEKLIGKGAGDSKQEAEMRAADSALKNLK